MPWFKIDDGFHCHPKVFAAGTPAVGLYVRCGSWAAQQVTDGVIPRQIAKLYGTPRMIKALIDAGLWHQAGHGCESCTEVDTNSYLIHQYLERNPSRVETELARESKTKRQQKWRENKKKQQVNDEEAPSVDGGVDASTSRHGDAAPVPTRPDPSPVPPTEVQLASRDGAEQLPMIGPQPRIPANCRPLVDALTANKMAVGWDLTTADWFLIEALIVRCGIPMLVDHAIGQWQSAKNRPRGGNYFIPGWRSLPDAPQADTPTYTPTAPASRQQQETDSWFDRQMARAKASDEQRKELSS
ncbi:hypothetical protein ACWEPB_02530 [Kitasatospora cineracea]